MDKNLDLLFMKEALLEAKKAEKEGEVPIGAVLVLNDKIIAKGYNQVEKLQDPTAHAEMICLSSAAADINDWRLVDTTLYVTIEPCIMCAGAIINSRVKKVVYGAKDLRVGAHGSFIDIFAKKHPIHNVEIEGGILEEEASFLLKSFFKKRRNEKSILKSLLD